MSEDWTKRCTITLLATDDEILWRAQRQYRKDGDAVALMATVANRLRRNPTAGGLIVERNTTSS